MIKRIITTTVKSPAKHNFTNTVEDSMISCFNNSCFSEASVIKFKVPWLNFSTKLINHSLVCRSTSYGTGLFKPITFLTPRANQSSCFITAITISDINSVAIAK